MKRYLLALGLLGLGACFVDDVAPPVTTVEPDWRRFDEALETAISEWNDSADGQKTPIRGASAAIIAKDQGTVHLKGYGEFAADRLYLVASASKILSVGVLMRLQDQGKLDIDAPISTYLKDWGDHKQDVTVAQLLSNSAGFPTSTEVIDAIFSGKASPRFDAHVCEWSPEGTLAECGKSIYQDDLPENNIKPDTKFGYGGSHWQLAGAIAEIVSGQSWAELVSETYVDSCDVKSLGYTNQSKLTDKAYQYPPSFNADAANAPETDNPLIEGGAYITAPDYAKLLHMHLQGGKCGNGRVLSASAVKRMQTDRVAAYGGEPSAPYIGYGLGWWIAPNFIADEGAYGTFPAIAGGGETAVLLMLEASSAAGGQVMTKLQPVLAELLSANQP